MLGLHRGFSFALSLRDHKDPVAPAQARIEAAIAEAELRAPLEVACANISDYFYMYSVDKLEECHIIWYFVSPTWKKNKVDA